MAYAVGARRQHTFMKHMVIKVDDYGWKWMKVHFCCNFFPSIYVYFPQIFQADSANCFATLWGVDDKEDGKESKFGQILLEVGWNFCPLYGGAIVPLGCVPKVFSSDDNSLSWLWMGRLYGWDPEKISGRKIARPFFIKVDENSWTLLYQSRWK